MQYNHDTTYLRVNITTTDWEVRTPPGLSINQGCSSACIPARNRSGAREEQSGLTEINGLTTNKLASSLFEVMAILSLWTGVTITAFLVKWTDAPFWVPVSYPGPVIRGGENLPLLTVAQGVRLTLSRRVSICSEFIT